MDDASCADERIDAFASNLIISLHISQFGSWLGEIFYKSFKYYLFMQ